MVPCYLQGIIQKGKIFQFLWLCVCFWTSVIVYTIYTLISYKKNSVKDGLMQAADISYNLFLQYTKWHSIHNSILYQVTKKHVDSQDILVVNVRCICMLAHVLEGRFGHAAKVNLPVHLCDLSWLSWLISVLDIIGLWPTRVLIVCPYGLDQGLSLVSPFLPVFSATAEDLFW